MFQKFVSKMGGILHYYRIKSGTWFRITGSVQMAGDDPALQDFFLEVICRIMLRFKSGLRFEEAEAKALGPETSSG